MNVEDFINVIHSEFYVGVPDSFLSPLCDYLVLTRRAFTKWARAKKSPVATSKTSGLTVMKLSCLQR